MMTIHKRARAFDEKVIRLTKQQTIFSLVPAIGGVALLAAGFAWYLIELMWPALAQLWWAMLALF